MAKKKSRFKRNRDSYIYTFTGRKFFPYDPTPDQVDIRDIAHALGYKCRFNGHTRGYCSVGQHSVNVSYAVPEADAFAGLMHDAHEAYCIDMPTPIKVQMPEYQEFEQMVWEAVAAKFGLDVELPASVKEADGRVLAAEIRDLMPKGSWNIKEAWGQRIVPWDFETAEWNFMARYEELRG